MERLLLELYDQRVVEECVCVLFYFLLSLCISVCLRWRSDQGCGFESCTHSHIVILFGVCGLPWFFPFRVSTLKLCVCVFVLLSVSLLLSFLLDSRLWPATYSHQTFFLFNNSVSLTRVTWFYTFIFWSCVLMCSQYTILILKMKVLLIWWKI